MTDHDIVPIHLGELDALRFIAKFALGVPPNRIRADDFVKNNDGTVEFTEVTRNTDAPGGWDETRHTVRISPPTIVRTEAHRDPQ